MQYCSAYLGVAPIRTSRGPDETPPCRPAAAKRFSLVDAVDAPIFRYFDVFDAIADTRVFQDTRKVRAWREALSERPSVKKAVGDDYPERLRALLVEHDTHLLKLAA